MRHMVMSSSDHNPKGVRVKDHSKSKRSSLELSLAGSVASVLRDTLCADHVSSRLFWRLDQSRSSIVSWNVPEGCSRRKSFCIRILRVSSHR